MSPIIWINPHLGGNHPYTTAYLAAMSSQPSADQISLIDDFVRSLVAGGLWDKLDALWLMMMHSADESRINLINPGTHDLSLSGSPSFSANVGWTGGASAYLYSTAVNGFTQYTQNDAHFGLWVENSVNENVPAIGHAVNVSEIRPHSGGNAYQMINGSYYGASYATATSLGHSAITRVSSTAGANYKNGAKQGSSYTNTSVALTSATFKVCGGIFSTCTAQISCAHLGSGLSDSEMSDLYDAIAAYRTGVAAL